MKNITLLFTLIFLTMSGKAQEKSQILPLMEEIIENSIQKNYNAVLDATYPKIFEIASREIMLDIFHSVLKNEDFVITLLPTDNEIEISEIKNIAGGKYALVNYNTSMSLKFNNMEGVDHHELVPILQMGFPASKVVYNNDKKAFDVLIRSNNLVISDEFTNGKWMFLNADKKDGQTLRLLLNEQILNAFDL